MSRRGGHRYALGGRPPPREGTQARCAYDALAAGRTVSLAAKGSRMKSDMIDYHGFELERVEPGIYRATGKYEGSVFVPIWPSL